MDLIFFFGGLSKTIKFRNQLFNNIHIINIIINTNLYTKHTDIGKEIVFDGKYLQLSQISY